VLSGIGISHFQFRILPPAAILNPTRMLLHDLCPIESNFASNAEAWKGVPDARTPVFLDARLVDLKAART
jgi:hypothetical protein